MQVLHKKGILIYFAKKIVLIRNFYDLKPVDLVCRRPYKGHQNQLKYLKFPFSMSPPL